MSTEEFLRLPQELLDLVTGDLRPGEIIALSTTCKELRARLEPWIGQHFFTDRTFLISDEISLSALLGISEHPVFSKSIQTIRFSFVKLIDIVADHSHDSRNGKCDWTNDKGSDEPYSELAKLQYRVWRVRDSHSPSYQACNRRMLVQDAFSAASGDVRYLRKILSNFSRSSRSPALIVGGDDLVELYAGGKVLHREKLTREVGSSTNSWYTSAVRAGRDRNVYRLDKSGYRFEVDVCDHRPLQILCHAIRQTSYPVTQLELGSRYLGVSLCSSELTPWKLAFSNLKVLRLALQLSRKEPVEYYPTGVPSKDSIQRLIIFLREAANLETLGLTSCYETVHASGLIFAFIAKDVSSTTHPAAEKRALRNIRILELDGFCFAPQDFTTFIRATRRTLKQVKAINEPEGMDSWEIRDWAEEAREAYGGPGLELKGSLFFE